MKIGYQLLEKYRVGDALTDGELATLNIFFGDLEESLKCLGTTYYIAWLPVFHDKLTIESYIENRKRGNQ